MYPRILVLVDGSDASDRALAEAFRWTRHFGSALRAVHVLDELRHVSGFETGRHLCDELLPHLQAAGGEILRRSKCEAHRCGVELETRLVDGAGLRLVDAVDEEVRAWHADLIVLGTHGRRGLERLALGSDAEQVLREARVPVLAVRWPLDSGQGPMREAT